MNIFDISPEKMKETSSVFTLTDINQQPSAWKKTVSRLPPVKKRCRSLQQAEQKPCMILLLAFGR